MRDRRPGRMRAGSKNPACGKGWPTVGREGAASAGCAANSQQRGQNARAASLHRSASRRLAVITPTCWWQPAAARQASPRSHPTLRQSTRRAQQRQRATQAARRISTAHWAVAQGARSGCAPVSSWFRVWSRSSFKPMPRLPPAASSREPGDAQRPAGPPSYGAPSAQQWRRGAA